MTRSKKPQADEPSDKNREAPNNVEAEQALLGAILMNNSALDRVGKWLEPEHFHEPINRKIYEVARQLIGMGKTTNPITIQTFLPSNEKIGSGDMTVKQYVARIAAEAVTVVNAYDYAVAIYDMSVRRKMIVYGENIVNVAYDAPPDLSPDKLAEEAQRDLIDIIEAKPMEDGKPKSRVGMGRQYIDEMNATKARGEVSGVPIVFEELKKVISEPCLEEGNLYGMLSSSSEGKTSLMVQMVLHALQKGNPVQVQSYDQSGRQLIRQMVSQLYEIEARRQRMGELSENEWSQALSFAQWIDEVAPFEVISCSSEGAPQLVAYARTFIKRPSRRVAKALEAGKVPLIVTDHIGSIAVEADDRRSDPGTKARNVNKVLKAGATALLPAWMVLNQRNTEGMKRDNPRPVSSDVYGGDSALQAYDAMFYLYRFRKYYEQRMKVASKASDYTTINKVFPETVRNGSEDIAEIGALKVRFGNPYITDTLDFEGRYTRYMSKKQAVLMDDMF